MDNDTFIFHDENDYFSTKKDAKLERKRVQKKDRSKYKKTDLGKRDLSFVPPDIPLKRGIVSSIRPQQFFVTSDGKNFICSLRGTLKQEKTLKKTLVIVGDYVLFEETGKDTGVIWNVEERKSVLSRADHLSQQKEHMIAANVDQVFITVSVVDPPLRVPIIDRYLIAATKGNLAPIIICNKIDLLDDPTYDEEERLAQAELLYECEKAYTSIGYTFLPVSSKTGEGIDLLVTILKDSISVFSGQSGAGKSSIINVATGLELKVGKTVARTRKGTHTTSNAQLLPLPFGGFCIDTPGIKSFGVWDLKAQDLLTYFFEINEAGAGCKFPDCRHCGEPGCVIPSAIETGTVSGLRYDSYLSLLEGLKQEHLRR